MDLYLIRHTRPDVGPDVCYGQLDVGLAADFAAAAGRLPDRLALPAGTVVITPAARRCLRLAESLAAVYGTKPVIDDRLRELDFGAWEGREWDAIPRVQTHAWARDIWNQAAPGGESYAAMHERVRAAWQGLPLEGAGPLAIVGPAGPLRAIMIIALELPADAFVRMHLDYGGIARLSDATGGWRLDFSNR